ncbi:MAG TPA: M23 family metallopeptidase, partial [Gaiellaceae bacterium]
RLGATAYPASGAVATFAALEAAGAQCRPGAVTISSLSLFGGAVTVSSLSGGAATGIVVEGSPVTLASGQVVAVGGWGQLVASAHVGRALSAPLALRLLAAQAGLPAGTVVLVGFTSTPRVAVRSVRKASAAPKPKHARRVLAKQRRHRRHRAAKHLPLKATPPLGLRHYVFPVAGALGVGDSYGGPRSDVSGGWHHGDDIFAPIGTPVLAVADGTLNRVGWERIGGWRLWVRDTNGNQFYYAHLAAYSRLALHAGRVRAGDVIGFVGRTGDAFTTTPHLHFEIHPRRFLHLHYDGAVDPTSYLLAWPHETPAHVPAPVRLRAPRGLPRLEAAVVWRQLLLARGIAPARRSAAASTGPLLPDVRGRMLEQVTAASSKSAPPPGRRRGLVLPLLLALAAAALGGGPAAVYARSERSRRTSSNA